MLVLNTTAETQASIVLIAVEYVVASCRLFNTTDSGLQRAAMCSTGLQRAAAGCSVQLLKAVGRRRGSLRSQ
jgi:hypothetical protein